MSNVDAMLDFWSMCKNRTELHLVFSTTRFDIRRHTIRLRHICSRIGHYEARKAFEVAEKSMRHWSDVR